MGATGAAAVRAYRRLSHGARQSLRGGADLSELRKPRRDRGDGRAARSKVAERLAARSRRRAALSGRRGCDARRRAHAPGGVGRALRAAPRHGRGHGARRAAHLAGNRRRAGRRNRFDRRQPRRLGRRHPGAQGDADQLSSGGGGGRRGARRHRRGARAPTCFMPPACTACCRRCSICRSPPITITGSFSTTTAANCRNRRNRPACANCGRKA